MKYLINLVFVWNIVVVIVFGIDKMLAKAHKRRISEKVLLLFAFFMGGLGAMFGMVLFNHKHSKMKFRILVPLAVLLGGMILYLVNKIY